ncbi:MAG: VanW family protein [Defluviitaleaceae bacterium]|nr:VanW family protein [Defluviitaleaceae bacterium]
MTTKKRLYLFLSAIFIIAISACGSYGDYYREGSINPPAPVPYERRVSRRSMSRNTVRHRPTPRPDQLQLPTPQPISPSRAAPGRSQPQPPYTHESKIPPIEMKQGFIPTPVAVTPPPANPTPQPTSQAPAPTNNAASTAELANKRQLASHKTEFDASDDNRRTNIAQASSSINGHVVQPGETFSYNQTVGPTIERRGYKESIIYVDGEKEKGFGGGVCQVSTTLSIAADEAGMTITERHDHSRPVSYAQEGEEAATSYGGIDFKFKNEKPFAVVIHSLVQDGNIYVSISEA